MLPKAAVFLAMALLSLAPISTAQTVSPTSSTETSLHSTVRSDGSRSVSTFEVRVSSSNGQDVPSGVVTFVDGDKSNAPQLGSVPINADGTATLTSANLLPGEHAIRAVYSGDATHAASASAASAVQTEVAATPTFSLSANPASATVPAGQTATSIIVVTPANGFSNYVALSCSGLPLQASCTFTPVNVAVGATAGTSTMTINTQAPSGPKAWLKQNDHGLLYAFLLPGILGLAGLSSSRGSTSRRGIRFGAMLLLVGSMVAGTASCAQRYTYLNRPPAASNGTPPGVSPITIQATSINGTQVAQQQLAFSLTVTAAPAP
jgi:hypothetical protein